jgi:hypothetical protein
MRMFSKKQINSSVMAIWLIGFLVFILCQAHPVVEGDHRPAAEGVESCQITTLPSATLSGSLLAAPLQAPGHKDSLFILTSALDVAGDFSYGGSGNAGPPILPLSSPKRYQLICIYRL